MKDHVRDWYMQAFPTDELGTEINPELTFDDALDAVALGGGFYDSLGVGDSVVRERVFEELADRGALSYGDVYQAWLEGIPVSGRPKEASFAASLDETSSMRDAAKAFDVDVHVENRDPAVER